MTTHIMLIDSGAEVNVISPKYEEKMRKMNEKLPILSLTVMSVNAQ